MPCLDKYPFLTDYFEKGIQNPDKNIAHCILFWGHDIDAQSFQKLITNHLMMIQKPCFQLIRQE